MAGGRAAEAGAHELAELRHLPLTGALVLPDAEQQEVARVTAEGDFAERLGMPPDAGWAAALERLEAGRRRAAYPLTDRATAEACEVVAHCHERLFSELATGALTGASPSLRTSRTPSRHSRVARFGVWLRGVPDLLSRRSGAA